MGKKKKEFTAESKLGFMRAIQVYNIFFILITFVGMTLIIGSTTSVSVEAVITVFQLIAYASTFWLISRRKMYARQIIIVLAILEYVLLMSQYIVHGEYEPIDFINNAIAPVILILYFIFSRRAKAVLVQPFSLKVYSKEEKEAFVDWNPRSKDFWLRLLIYFFAFSIMGHWMEMGVQILVINGIFPGTIATADSLTWRDNLNPFFIYGIAVFVCGAALYPIYQLLLKKCPNKILACVISFLINMTFCVAAELILGFAVNGDHHAWDYSDQFMNFEGQICLLYSLCFGVLSSVITWVLYPFMERQFSYVSQDLFRWIFVICLVVFLAIVATYNIDPNYYGEDVKGYTQQEVDDADWNETSLEDPTKTKGK